MADNLLGGHVQGCLDAGQAGSGERPVLVAGVDATGLLTPLLVPGTAGVPATTGIPVDTELPAAALINGAFDTNVTPAPTLGAVMLALSQGGTLASPVKGHDQQSDARVNTIFGAVVDAYGYLFNGTSEDRYRNNTEVTALASAARTATTSSADITNYNSVGVIVTLNVTAASGTGGLQVGLQIKDPISGSYKQINVAPTAILATGTSIYIFYPGASITGNFNQINTAAVPRTFRITVTHGDGTSYTYSVALQFVN